MNNFEVYQYYENEFRNSLHNVTRLVIMDDRFKKGRVYKEVVQFAMEEALIYLIVLISIQKK